MRLFPVGAFVGACLLIGCSFTSLDDLSRGTGSRDREGSAGAGAGDPETVLPSSSTGGGGCAIEKKACGGSCVAGDDPSTGCAEASCEPCALAHATAACAAGRCAVAPCDAGWGDCDGDAANGCEVELGADPQHCGACGHGCCGGDCSASSCQPVALAAGQDGLWELALDDTYVYFTATEDEAVRRIAKAGGAPETLASAQTGVHGIAVDASRVYWTTDTLLRSAAKDGTGPTTLASDDTPWAVSVYGDADGFVYWTSCAGAGSGVRKIEKDGSGTPKTIASTSGNACAVTADLTRVYWTDEDADFYGVVLGAAKVNGNSTVVANDGDVFYAAQLTDLAVDADSVYWVNPVWGKVMKASKAGGAAVALAVGLAVPASVAVDATSVYWASIGNDLTAGEGDIRKIDKNGVGPAVILASQQAAPHGIAVDEHCVYWSNTYDGTLWALAK